jgi:ADP-ribose pyrophosphatase YjhB (NUDIX family)
MNPSQKEGFDNAPTHAGAVTIRIEKHSASVLLVTAKNKSDEWVLPKGHIKRHETPEDACLRELREEAGVFGRIVKEISRAQFTRGEESNRIVYFLVRFVKQEPSSENRIQKWCSYEQALLLLSFEDAQKALRAAEKAIQLELE